MTTPTDAGSLATTAGAGLDVQQVAQRFARVTAMIEAGNPRAARRELATVTAHADEPTGRLLVSCLAALERPRAVGMPMLRHLWKSADEHGRELIEAVSPRTTAPMPMPGTVPVPRPGERTRGPVSATRTRREAPRGRRGRRETAGAPDVARYFAQDAAPGGVDALTDDEPERGSDYPGHVEDEAAALVPVAGTVCVSCWVERPTAEQHRTDDDGLCSDCRDRGAVGVVVPARADRASKVRARVAHIARHAASPEQARRLLLQEWSRARGADRRVIVNYVHQHPDTVARADAPAHSDR